MFNPRFGFGALLLFNSFVFGQSDLPSTPKHSVIDQYHGVKVSDNYRWLEDWNNPETQAWSNAENAYARQYLDAIKGREQLRSEIKESIANPSVSFFRLRLEAGRLFAMLNQPPKEQPFLVTLQSVNEPASAYTILDPTQVNPGSRTAIDFYEPSHNGEYVAVSLSKGGLPML